MNSVWKIDIKDEAVTGGCDGQCLYLRYRNAKASHPEVAALLKMSQSPEDVLVASPYGAVTG